MALFSQIHMKSRPKVKLGQVKSVRILLRIISGHYLPQFTSKVDQK